MKSEVDTIRKNAIHVFFSDDSEKRGFHHLTKRHPVRMSFCHPPLSGLMELYGF